MATARKLVILGVAVVGFVVGLKIFRLVPPSINPAHLLGGALFVSGAALLLGGRLSRAPMSPASRRRLTAIGIAQVLFGCSSVFLTGVSSLILQGLVALAMVLLALRLPRRLFADPSGSRGEHAIRTDAS